MIESSASTGAGEQRARAPTARVDFLDGIRGWASFAVLLTHIVINLLALSAPTLILSADRFGKDVSDHRYLDLAFTVLLGIFTNGHLAVFIFFVLSGYALSFSHFNLEKNTLASAAASRYFRLMIPVLSTSLIVYALLKAGLFFNIRATAASSLDPGDWLPHAYEFPANLKDLVTFAFYDVFFKYKWETSYNIALWTMPIELTGSFLIYGFLAIFRRTSTVQWAMAAFIAVALFDSTPVFACFIFGYLIAELNARFLRQTKRTTLELALIASFAIVCVLSTTAHFQGDRATCLLATCIVGAVSFSGTLRAVFSAGVSKLLGRISFPLYLIQIPVICSWSSYLFLKLPASGHSISAATLINLSTTILICLLLSIGLLPLERFSISASKRLGGMLLGRSGITNAAAYPASKNLHRQNPWRYALELAIAACHRSRKDRQQHKQRKLVVK